MSWFYRRPRIGCNLAVVCCARQCLQWRSTARSSTGPALKVSQPYLPEGFGRRNKKVVKGVLCTRCVEGASAKRTTWVLGSLSGRASALFCMYQAYADSQPVLIKSRPSLAKASHSSHRVPACAVACFGGGLRVRPHN